MGKKYIIGIDVGSQSSKVMIYDLDGNLVCEAKEPLQPMHLAEDTVVEHPGDDLWDSLCVAAKKLMTDFTGDPQDILGIGLGAIRCCRVLLKKDGTLAAPAISWMDKRVSVPYQHTNPEVAYVTTTDGYLTHRLTGEFRDNIGNYYGQWPVDYDAWDWSTDPEVLKQYNIPRDMLFDVGVPGAALGTVTREASEATGFPEGLPVLSTTSDKAVEGLGAGLVRAGTAVVSLGTYITCMVIKDEMPPADAQAYWGIMSSIPHRYIYESYGIRRGMWTVSWFRDLLGEEVGARAREAGISAEEYLDRRSAEIPAGSDGLMTKLDWLANPWEPFKRGVMIGFNADHDFRYMYRSILEGIAYTMKNNVDALMAERGEELGELIIVGGGSNGDLFMQIFADVFDVPVKRNVVASSAGLGAAINAAVGLGAYDSYEEAVAKMVKVKDTFVPIAANAERYRKLNAVYKTISTYTDEVLKATYEALKA